MRIRYVFHFFFLPKTIFFLKEYGGTFFSENSRFLVVIVNRSDNPNCLVFVMSSLFMELLVLQPHLVGHVMHLFLRGGGHRVGDHVTVVRVGTAATSRIASQVQCVLG